MQKFQSGRTAATKGETRPFPPPRDYSSLSIVDLLDAREAYHVHLSNIDTVLATAIGRYRIQQDDWYATHPPSEPRPSRTPRITGPRTFENSVVRPWSWPCVIVMVKVWGVDDRADLVPPRLYLADGRVVPTCVVLARPDERPAPLAEPPIYASDMIGGGYRCTRTAQGVTRVGTIACLVERDGTYYALTNRHVAGPDGGSIDAVVRGRPVTIGSSDTREVDRAPMSTIFPGWPGERTVVNVDAGLIAVDDASVWTSQAFGIGEIGDMFDATTSSLTLDLIGTPLRAYGADSGVLQGEIQAMFVRYKTLNGTDYVSDLLIGRRKPHEDTHGRSPTSVDTGPGDSGTLWFYDPPNSPLLDTPHDPALMPPEPPPERGKKARRLRPVAMQWGGQRLVDLDGKAVSHALGTFVSTVCRLLDVEIVTGYGTGHDEYWGKVGHFSIGWKACDRIDGAKFGALAKLMTANQVRIGYPDDTIASGKAWRVGHDGFIPLADVPDYVFGFGGTYGAQQHFADIDIQTIDGRPSMLDQCVADPTRLSAKVWKDYFDGFAAKGVGPDEGTLPFRVWQLWDLMVASLQAGNIKSFLAAGGVMAHFVGDASQPLHCSYLHHGRSPTEKIGNLDFPYRKESPQYAAYYKTPPAKIHSIYEETMLERDTATALELVDKAVEALPTPVVDITTGWDAGLAVIGIMDASRKRLSPQAIIDADDPSLGQTARADRLWANDAVQTNTIACLADSVQTLARLWMSAWEAGDGDAITDKDIRAYTEAELLAVYKDKSFAPGLSLAQMVTSGDYEPAAKPAPKKPAPKKPTTKKPKASPAKRPKKRTK